MRTVERRLALSLALASGLVAASTVAQAQSAPDGNWTGFSIYAGGGISSLQGDVDMNDTTEYGLGTSCDQVKGDVASGLSEWTRCPDTFDISKTFSNSISSVLNGDTSVFGTVGVGADFEPVTGIVLGGFADIDWSNADLSFSGSGSSSSITCFFDCRLLNVEKTGQTSFSGKIEYDYSYTLGGRIGVLSLDRQALLYVLAGYTRLETDGKAQIDNSVDVDINVLGHTLFETGYNAKGIAVSLPSSYQGLTVGAGAEVKLSSIWSLKLEGRYTNLQSETVKYSSKSSDSKTLKHYGRGCSDAYFNSNASNVDCAYNLNVSSDSNGSIDIDPEIWSGRVVLSLKLN